MALIVERSSFHHLDDPEHQEIHNRASAARAVWLSPKNQELLDRQTRLGDGPVLSTSDALNLIGRARELQDARQALLEEHKKLGAPSEI